MRPDHPRAPSASCRRSVRAAFRQPEGQLGARSGRRASVDAREALDGVLGEEERGGDLAVRAALGDERRDPALGLGQLAARGRAAADARQLGARLLGPERRAEALERGERLLEGGAGGAAPLRAPLRPAEREQRARVLERIRAAGMLGERALEAREGAVEIAARREQQPATAGEDRQRPGPVERVARAPATSRGSRRPRRARRPRSAPRAGRPARGACAGSSMKALRSSYERRRYASAAAASPSESSTKPSTQPWPDCAIRIPSASARATAPCALRARVVDPALVSGDDGSGKLVVRRQAAELRQQVQRVGRISVGLVPVPRPPLEEAQLPQRFGLVPRGRSAPCTTLTGPPGRAPRAVDVR